MKNRSENMKNWSEKWIKRQKCNIKEQEEKKAAEDTKENRSEKG